MDPVLVFGFIALAYIFVSLLRLKAMARHATAQLPILTQQVAHAAAVMTVTALFEEHGEKLVPIGPVTKQDAATLVDHLAKHWYTLDNAAVENLRATLPHG